MAKRYSVSGYPTLKMFRAKVGDDEEGVREFGYDGPREHKGIVDYLIKQSGQAATVINSPRELKDR